MSLFTKILAFLNLLGIAALAYLATMTYAKRQAWAYAVFRHDLVLQGLPLDPADTDSLGRPYVDNLGEETLRELFPAAPVTSQQAEVERVHNALQGQVSAAGDQAKQTAVYARLLLPLAVSYREREDLLSVEQYLRDADSKQQLGQQLERAATAAQEVLRLAQNPADPMQRPDRAGRTFDEAFSEMLTLHGGDPKRPFEAALLEVLRGAPNTPLPEATDKAIAAVHAQLKARFDNAFKEALASTYVDSQGKEQEITPEQRKVAIARLLLAVADHLPEAAAQQGGARSPGDQVLAAPLYQRIFTVVGLNAAVPAMEHRGLLLGRFIDESRVEAGQPYALALELAREMQRERSRFLAQHQTLTAYLQGRAVDLATITALVDNKKGKLDAQNTLLEERTRDVARYLVALKILQDQTAVNLAALREKSKELFDVRVRTRDATRQNQEFYQEILRLERTAAAGR